MCAVAARAPPSGAWGPRWTALGQPERRPARPPAPHSLARSAPGPRGPWLQPDPASAPECPCPCPCPAQISRPVGLWPSCTRRRRPWPHRWTGPRTGLAGLPLPPAPRAPGQTVPPPLTASWALGWGSGPRTSRGSVPPSGSRLWEAPTPAGGQAWLAPSPGSTSLSPPTWPFGCPLPGSPSSWSPAPEQGWLSLKLDSCSPPPRRGEQPCQREPPRRHSQVPCVRDSQIPDPWEPDPWALGVQAWSRGWVPAGKGLNSARQGSRGWALREGAHPGRGRGGEGEDSASSSGLGSRGSGAAPPPLSLWESQGGTGTETDTLVFAPCIY